MFLQETSLNLSQVRLQPERILLDNHNTLSSQQLNKLIIERKENKYRLYKLLSYNNTTEPEDLLYKQTYEPETLREIMSIDDIIFEDTIMYLQKLNTLYFIFVEEIAFNLKSKQQTEPLITQHKRSTRRKRKIIS